jgi:Na+-driven multidrug efflux pump
MIVPIGIGIITRIVSSYGAEAVAAYGVASRVEFFALMVLMSLAAVFAPFVGQNWGAGRLDRVRRGMRSSEKFSLMYGLGAFIFLAAAAHPTAAFFNRNPDVITGIKLYLRIVPLAYGLQGILTLAGAALNALNKPLHAAVLVLTQMIIVYVPLAYLGSKLFSLAGVFGALALVYALGGVAGHFLFGRVLGKEGG